MALACNFVSLEESYLCVVFGDWNTNHEMSVFGVNFALLLPKGVDNLSSH